MKFQPIWTMRVRSGGFVFLYISIALLLLVASWSRRAERKSLRAAEQLESSLMKREKPGQHSRERDMWERVDRFELSASRLREFVFPEPTVKEDRLLSLRQHLGYEKRCEDNREAIWVDAALLGSGFSNKLIGFTNLLYYSRAQNTSIWVTPEIEDMLFQHYDAGIVMRYFCVLFDKDGTGNNAQQSENLDVREEKLQFYWRRVHKHMNSSEFRFTVLRHILLRPKPHILKPALSFLSDRGWHQYTAIHLRSFPPFYYVFRNFIQQCVHCAFTSHMSNKYVLHMRREHGFDMDRKNMNIFLMADGENETDVERLKRLGAQQISTAGLRDKADLLHVEMLVAAFATLLLGSPSSSLSTNIAIVQQGVQLIDNSYSGGERNYANNVLPIMVPNFMR